MLALDYLSSNLWTLTFVCTILGLSIGSFLNVMVYRIPIMLEKQWRAQAREILTAESQDPKATPPASPITEKTFNLVYPNSHCPHCETAIKPWHNIPVISYLLLGGKCAKCAHPISKRYPIVEMVTAILTILVVWQFGFTLQSAALLVFSWALITLTLIDFDHQLLPDNITLPLLWAGLIVNSSGLIVTLPDALWGAVAGYLSLWSVYWLFKLITGKEGMGYGDFKLLAALGAWLGWQTLPLIIMLSSLVGAAVGLGLILLRGQDKNTPIPFGPYLAIAGWIAALWGESIIVAYSHYLG